MALNKDMKWLKEALAFHYIVKIGPQAFEDGSI